MNTMVRSWRKKHIHDDLPLWVPLLLSADIHLDHEGGHPNHREWHEASHGEVGQNHGHHDAKQGNSLPKTSANRRVGDHILVASQLTATRTGRAGGVEVNRPALLG